MRGLGAIMSSATDEWMTPPEVLDRIRQVATIRLDPCTTEANPVGAEVYFTAETNGLARSWYERVIHFGEQAFVNPPYSDMDHWSEKVVEEAVKGCPITLLVPARTDTRWFHRVLPVADNVVLWRGRIRFLQPDGTARTGAPFPSAILTLNLPTAAVRTAFLDVGEVLRGPRWR